MGARADREKLARKIRKGDVWYRGSKSVTFVKWLERNGPRSPHPILVVESEGKFRPINLEGFVKNYRPC